MFFSNLVGRIFPKVRAEEEEEPELEDPQQTLREKCREAHHAKPYLEKLEECTNRVNSRTQTTETCAEELLDLLHVIDHCVTAELFCKLK